MMLLITGDWLRNNKELIEGMVRSIDICSGIRWNGNQVLGIELFVRPTSFIHLQNLEKRFKYRKCNVERVSC